MSNIDKRALREAAERACADNHTQDEWFHYLRCSSPETVLALLDEMEAVQKTSAARLGAIDTTHKMFQRERDRADAAEKRSAELSQKADIYDMLRQDYGLQGSLVDFVDWQSKRIAELEAKKVKIKLPESFYPDGDIDCPLVINEYQIIEAIVAADCKPIAVCPRCKCELDLSHKPDGAHYCHSAAADKGEAS